MAVQGTFRLRYASYLRRRAFAAHFVLPAPAVATSEPAAGNEAPAAPGASFYHPDATGWGLPLPLRPCCGYDGHKEIRLIEKAFAIQASPDAIWDALWADLSQGDHGRYTLEASSRPSRLELRVDMSGIECLLTYTLTPMEEPGLTEVAANLAPVSKRYGLYYLLTFGHIKRNYEMLLVEGLANLKAHVEGTEST